MTRLPAFGGVSLSVSGPYVSQPPRQCAAVLKEMS